MLLFMLLFMPLFILLCYYAIMLLCYYAILLMLSILLIFILFFFNQYYGLFNHFLPYAYLFILYNVFVCTLALFYVNMHLYITI